MADYEHGAANTGREFNDGWTSTFGVRICQKGVLEYSFDLHTPLLNKVVLFSQ